MATKTVSLPNIKPSAMHEHTSSCGRLSLQMTLAQALGASHQGQCDADVAALISHPSIAVQLAATDPVQLRAELAEWGAWDDEELADTAQNLHRWVWLAACDIRENVADTLITD